MKAKKVEYTSLTQREHVLKRPGMYIGSIESSDELTRIINNSVMELQNISLPSGLIKLINEAIDNAKDNIPRSLEQGTPQKFIKINIVEEPSFNSFKITIANDGHCIPVEQNDKGELIPSVVFGKLLSGSNYNDSDTRTGIGTNGLGIKLVSIFSREFTVNIKDPINKKTFTQTWKDSMTIETKSKVSAYSGKSSLVEISFIIDTSLFVLPQNYYSQLFAKLETIATVTSCLVTANNVKVYFNDKLLKTSSSANLFKMFDPEVITCEIDTELGKWFIGVSERKQEETISYVNGSETKRGGKHVNYIANKVTKYLSEFLKKKTKKNITEGTIKNYMCFYVIATVKNPTFDSQTKDFMDLEYKSWGVKFDIPETFLKKLTKSKIVDNILADMSVKENKSLEKISNSSRIIGIPKLTDANKAGVEPEKCTLFITEGDSANGMANNGIATVGHNYYGSFPIRGKILNVRDASVDTIVKNEEIQNIIKILNLQMNKSYTKNNKGQFVCENNSVLRYSTLAVMADQDTDGSHIKGLLLNFISFFWPSLLEQGFVKVFVTPIVKLSKIPKETLAIAKSSKSGLTITKNNEIMFFSLPDYKRFEESVSNKNYKVKYYKGLGTSNKDETNEYFSSLDRHIIPFENATPEQFCYIDLAFRKSRADDRKQWILGESSLGEPCEIDFTIPQTIANFVRDELSLFSIDNLTRSIPSITDGLKPSQRKILYSAFKKGLKDHDHEIKVSQFSGYISQITEYHHGEVSLEGAIVSMAQTFVGSNNIPLLIEDGNFGSRNKGGADSAASRYIYTYLNPISEKIFKPEDNNCPNVLEYLVEEGIQIEPKYYCPVIPMILVNGATGIGTGWSTSVPCWNPKQIIEYLKSRLLNKKPKLPSVYYNGFKGEIIETKTKIITRGIINEIKNGFEITELPIGTWTFDYKEYLCKLREQGVIKTYEEHHGLNDVHFKILLTPSQMKSIDTNKDSLLKFFKLESSISLTNMTMFTPDNKIKVYTSVKDILEDWYSWRITLFAKRKEYILEQNGKEVSKLENIIRFINKVIKDPNYLLNKKIQGIIDTLEKDKFDKYQGSYDYLLSIKAYAFTHERIVELQSKINHLQNEISELQSKTEEVMFLEDLEQLSNAV